MLFAAIGDTTYNVFLLLHIASALVAFAPALVNPLLLNGMTNAPEAQRSGVAATMLRNSRRIYAPALVITGVLGFGLAGMSDDVYNLSDGWLAGAVALWVAMNGLLHALVIPNERKLSDGDWSAASMVTQATAAISVLLLIMLWLMVWKPGA